MQYQIFPNLNAIVVAAKAIAWNLRCVSEEEFLGDNELQKFVLSLVIKIGNAGTALPDEFLLQHNELRWGYTHVLACANYEHGYLDCSWLATPTQSVGQLVWETATQDIPILCEQIAKMLIDYSEETENS